jgi:hypothetical protein
VLWVKPNYIGPIYTLVSRENRFSPTFAIDRDRGRERRKGLKRKNKRKGLEARARRGIHHLGAKLKLGL